MVQGFTQVLIDTVDWCCWSHINAALHTLFTFSWFLGPSVCRHAGTVCQQEYVVDLLSQSPQFDCTCSEKKQNTSQEIPVISRTVPATSVSDPAFAGILSLISKTLFYPSKYFVKTKPHHMFGKPPVLFF